MPAQIGTMQLNVIKIAKTELKEMAWRFRYRTVGNQGAGPGQFYVRDWTSVNKGHQALCRREEWKYAENP